MNPTTLRPSSAEADTWPELPDIDTAAARQCCGDSLELFKRLLGLLQKNYGGWSEQWLLATSTGHASDKAALCASLHKLRGSAGLMGAHRLALVAGQVEQSLKEDQEQPQAAVQRVGDVLHSLLVQIGAWQASVQARGG